LTNTQPCHGFVSERKTGEADVQTAESGQSVSGVGTSAPGLTSAAVIVAAAAVVAAAAAAHVIAAAEEDDEDQDDPDGVIIVVAEHTVSLSLRICFALARCAQPETRAGKTLNMYQRSGAGLRFRGYPMQRQIPA
jgi:hypothetical protein